MASLRTDIAFNLAGRLYTAAIAFFFVPVYIKLLGIEAFGLVGFVNSLFAMAAIFDVGLSTTINREMAKMAAEGAAASMRDLVRTMELPYWGFALILGGTMYATAPFIAGHWISGREFSPADLERAVKAGAVFVAMQMPSGLYSGGLLGLRQQVLWNGVQSAAATVRHVGAVLVLLLVSRTIDAFLIWQAVASGLQVAATLLALSSRLPRAARRARIRLGLLSQSWRFATGVTSLTLLSALILQMDKIMLSVLAPLSTLGYYTAASVVARNIYIVATPVFSAAYPRLTQVIHEHDGSSLSDLFRRYSQVVTLLLTPLAVVIMLFPWEVLFLWTHNSSVAANGVAVLPILTAASLLNGLSDVPYTVALAAGKTRIVVLVYVCGFFVLLPAMYLGILALGVVGAAIALLGFWLGALIALTPMVLRPLLPGATQQWWVRDVTVPLLVSVAATAALRAVSSSGGEDRVRAALLLAASFLVASCSCAVASDWLCGVVRRHLRIKATS